MQNKPLAFCMIDGSSAYRSIKGMVLFYENVEGVLIQVKVKGLPMKKGYKCGSSIFGFHIHEGTMCSGTMQEPFKNAGGHYNPQGCEHPQHAGDLPPLFASRNGSAMMSFVDDRFTVEEIIGRVMIIHENPDDFHTQPSGNSGPMIACGKIESMMEW